MDDLISRQAAIDALDRIGSLDTEADKKYARSVFEALPSAQPKRKKGKWLDGRDPIIVSGTCSCCGWESILFETDVAGMPFCPNCGADMRGERSDE